MNGILRPIEGQEVVEVARRMQASSWTIAIGHLRSEKKCKAPHTEAPLILVRKAVPRSVGGQIESDTGSFMARRALRRAHTLKVRMPIEEHRLAFAARTPIGLSAGSRDVVWKVKIEPGWFVVAARGTTAVGSLWREEHALAFPACLPIWLPWSSGRFLAQEISNVCSVPAAG
jgi:hypothetical protein